jgi:ATP-binding cassette, subfamily C, bacterial LapB
MARESDLDQKAAVSAKRTDPPRPYAPSEAARGTETQPPDSVDQGRDSGSAGLLNPLDSGRNDPNAGRAERDLLSPEALHRHFERASAANDTAAALNEVADDVAKTAGAAKSPRRPAEQSDADESNAPGAGPQEFDSARNAAAERRANRNRREGPRDSKDRRSASTGWQIRPTPGTKDDPLLGCLTILCTLLERNISSEALTSALPLVDGMLTPELFVRAAERAGISSRLQRRNLDSVSKLSLPCVLLLSRQRACVLTDIRRDEGRATIILPEMGAGTRDVAYDELVQEYVGYALFARPEFQYDKRAQDDRIADPKGWFWGTLLNSWKLYIEVGVAAIMVNCFAIASPLFTMNVYDRVVPNFAEETLWVLVIGISIVYGFDFMLKLIRGYLVDVAGKTADTKIAARLFQQVMGMKMANRPPSAGGLANSMREFESLREFFTSSTVTALVDFPFIFLFLGVIAIIGSPAIVAIPAFMVFLAIICGFIVQIQMRKIVQETTREAMQKHAILIEAISGAETIKATASEGRMQRAWETFVSKTASSSMKATRWSQFALNLSGFFTQFVTVTVVLVGVYEIHEGNMTTGALVACTILAGRAMAPLSQIAGIATRFNQAWESLNALDKMMQTPVERPEGRSFVHRPEFNGMLEFKNVKFTYPEAKTTALSDVSFKIEAGEKVGIIGRIGSGKSTIERLLLGLYDPDEGSVLVDGTDVRQIDPADLRRSVGVVPQDVYLFFGTVKENIALGAPYADDSAILRAARISAVDEFISKHPLGLDLPVGERGLSLSGGQRQAIAVARALLLDPPILLLDEPTSAMDNTTEGRFKARLGTVLTNKTLILVTHRGSLLTLVDRLIVMDGGRIVADGPKEIVMEALASGRIQAAKV